MAAQAEVATPRQKAHRKEAMWGYGLTSIWLVGFIVFAAFPLAMAVFISFTSWDPIQGPFWNAHTVGLKNYSTFLQDARYWHSVRNTIYYSVGSVALVNIIAIPVAILLNQKLRGINFFRTVFYLPAIMPAVATVLIFRTIFQPGVGFTSWLLTNLHLQCDTRQVTCNPIDWISDPHFTMPVVIIISAWALGQTLLIYLAGLQGIDTSYYEAAAIDGAGAWERFRAITLPLLTPAIFFNVVTGLIGALQEFTKFVIYSGGGDANGGPGDSLLTTLWYIYIQAFQFSKMGLATAMAFGLFVLIGIFTAINFIGQKRWVFYQEERT